MMNNLTGHIGMIGKSRGFLMVYGVYDKSSDKVLYWSFSKSKVEEWFASHFEFNPMYEQHWVIVSSDDSLACWFENLRPPK